MKPPELTSPNSFALAYNRQLTSITDYPFSDPSAKGSVGVRFGDKSQIPSTPCVYIVVREDGGILYVGESADARARHRFHERSEDFVSRGAVWIYWEEFASKQIAKDRETYILRHHGGTGIRTPLNKQGANHIAAVPIPDSPKAKIALLCNLQLLKKVATDTFNHCAQLFSEEVLASGAHVDETRVGKYTKRETEGYFLSEADRLEYDRLLEVQAKELRALKESQEKQRATHLEPLRDQGRYQEREKLVLYVSPAGMLIPNPDLVDLLFRGKV